MDEAFKEFLQRFFKRYGISPDGIYFDNVRYLDSMLRQLENCNIDFSAIRQHLEVIFDLHEKGICIYKANYKDSKEYSLEKDIWIPTNENIRISTENYIERFLLDEDVLKAIYKKKSMYTMGRPCESNDKYSKKSLVDAIKKLMDSQQHMKENYEKYNTSKFIKKIYRPREFIYDQDGFVLDKQDRLVPLKSGGFAHRSSELGYRSGGLIERLKKHLDFDITLFTEKEYDAEICEIINFFTEKEHNAEICKIIYFFFELEHTPIIPKLQGKQSKRDEKNKNKNEQYFNAVDFLSNPSMENIGYSFSGRETYNGKITDLIKNTIEKEMYQKETSLEAIDDIKVELDQVADTWDKLLDDAHKAIYTGKEFNFDRRIRVLESILGKPHKAIPANYKELLKFAPRAVCKLNRDRGTRVLKSLLNRLKKTGVDVNLYEFTKIDVGKKIDFDQGIFALESMLDIPHEGKVTTFDDVRFYTFKAIGTDKKIRVCRSMPSKLHTTVEVNTYLASPIEILYLKVCQSERLGEVKDKKWVNDIGIEADYDVPQEFVDRMKLLKNEPIGVGDVEKYIDENITEIAEFVYPKLKATGEEYQSILASKKDVSKVLDCCVRAGSLIPSETQITRLHVISCLQAILMDQDILTDKESDDGYTFYDYQHHLKTKRKLKNDKYTVEAIKFYWARKAEEHWYANLGQYELCCKLREFESKLYEVLTKIYSCSNIFEMESMSQDYYGKLQQPSVFLTDKCNNCLPSVVQ